ncbi:MAG: insulinase family protein, partial [Rhodospirillales bacterium]|nr:insulinase family protein [Rhodospirillales bacterium]
ARADTPERTRPTEPPQRAERRVTYYDERVRQPSWQQIYLAPSYVSGETKHAYALEVLSDILGGGATSRLYRSMVIENKLAVGSGAYYSPDRLGPGVFGLYASPRPGVSMEDVESAIAAEIEKIMMGGVTQDEVARSVRSMKASAIYARDSLTTGARVLGSALTTGQTIVDVESWPERIANVTTEDVMAAAKLVFNKRSSVTSLLLPETEKGE